MINLTSLVELPDVATGEQVSFVALVTDIKVMATTAGKDYVRLYIRDDKAAISVPLWNDTIESAKSVYAIDEIYSITATTKDYKGGIVIDRILAAAEVTDENITKRLKQNMFKHATNDNISMILESIESLKDSCYYPYLAAIYGTAGFDDPKFIDLCKAFASINHHDNYPGGFINHIGGMLHIARYLKNKYLLHRCEDSWTVDWDFIYAAILLHDIGKLKTYTSITEYTVRFKDACLLNHNSIGVGMLYAIEESLDPEKRCPYAVFQQLVYTVLYHDDITKLYEHKRLEDKIISYVDGLDSTLAVSCTMEV